MILNNKFCRLFAYGLISCLLIQKPAFSATINEVNNIDFGEILGLSGSCDLDWDTKITSDAGGQLCPSTNVNYGEPGKYVIVADPYTQFSIRIKNRINPGDGLSFYPDGVYRVFGESDINILQNQFQTVDSGATGVITIIIGGTLISAIDQNFNTPYNINISQGITYNELP